jgi:hypothetical protein
LIEDAYAAADANGPPHHGVLRRKDALDPRVVAVEVKVVAPVFLALRTVGSKEIAPYLYVSYSLPFLVPDIGHICERSFDDAVVTAVRLPAPSETLSALEYILRVKIRNTFENGLGETLARARA